MASSQLNLHGGNALAGKGNQPFNDNPLSLTYTGKAIEIGNEWRIRILSLHADHVREIPTKRDFQRPQKSGGLTKLPVFVPQDEKAARAILDHGGTALSELRDSTTFRIPIWVYEHFDPSGKITPVNKLMFLEFGPGLASTLDKLGKAQRGRCAFNEDTGRPEYDIMLRVVASDNTAIPKNYDLEPVLTDEEGEKHENFKVKAEKVLDAEWPDIIEAWPDLQTAMDKGRSLKEILKKMGFKEEEEETEERPRAGLSRTIAAKPDMTSQSRTSRVEEEEDEAPVARRKPREEDEEAPPARVAKPKVEPVEEEEEEPAPRKKAAVAEEEEEKPAARKRNPILDEQEEVPVPRAAKKTSAKAEEEAPAPAPAAKGKRYDYDED